MVDADGVEGLAHMTERVVDMGHQGRIRHDVGPCGHVGDDHPVGPGRGLSREEAPRQHGQEKGENECLFHD